MTGREVEVTDLTGCQEPGTPRGIDPTTTSTILDHLRFNPTTRDAVRAADIILIATGGNELEACGRPRLAEIARVTCRWNASARSDASGPRTSTPSSTEIHLLREGAPTVIRLVDEPNLFLLRPRERRDPRRGPATDPWRGRV